MTLEEHRRNPAKLDISELRAGPARVFERAGDGTLAVLNHCRPAGYIVSNAWMKRVFDQLDDGVLITKAVSRVGTLKQARPISLDEL